MRYFAALLAAAAVASAATKSLSTYMPECAVPCLTTAIGAATTCKGPEDLECFCIADNYRAIYDNAVGCVLQRCGDDVAITEVLPKAARMCEEVVAASGQPVTSVGAPSPTSSDSPGATGDSESGSPDATSGSGSNSPDATSDNEGASTSTNAADARFGAHVLGLVAPLVLAAAANL